MPEILPTRSPGGTPPTVLVVEDHPVLRALYDRVLRRAGFGVRTARGIREARDRLEERQDDAVVLSDLWLPDGTGLDVLSMIPARETAPPVLIVTAEPSIETAIGAIERGVHRYLCKPLAEERLVDEVRGAARLHALARLRHQASAIPFSQGGAPADDELRAGWLDRALAGLWLAAQPIVRLSSGDVYAYEVLLRCALEGFVDPRTVIAAAEREGRLWELGWHVRRAAAQRVQTLAPGQRLFVNLHPADLLDPSLCDARDPLFAHAEHVTLEITERARLEGLAGVEEAVHNLRAVGYAIAIDDLGAGYSGLTSLANFAPQVVKLDMSLVRGIDRDDRRQALVAGVVGLCARLNMEVVAEGVETPRERDTLRTLGLDLLQGYLFARPGPALPTVQATAWKGGP